MGRNKRIEVIKKQPADTKYFVLDQHDRYWKANDRGYTEDVNEAKKFTQADIIERLENGGLMDKTIHMVH